MPMPPDVLALVAEVMDRSDFIAIEKHRDEGKWSVGLRTGRLRADGSREALMFHDGRRLSELLEHVRKLPVAPPLAKLGRTGT